MMHTNRALASLTLATTLFITPDVISAQYSRGRAVRHASVAYAASAGRSVPTEHRVMLVAVSSGATTRDMLDSVRRQPRDLLNGIDLSRAERKAVNGIVRKNGKQLRILEQRRRASNATAASQQRVEQDIAALRDRERSELRRVLTPAHRRQFDHNLALIGPAGL